MQTRQPTKEIVKNKRWTSLEPMLQGALGGQDLTLAPRKTDLNSPLAFRNLFSRSGEVFPLAAREAPRRHSPSKEAPENREEQPCLKVRKSSINTSFPGGKQHLKIVPSASEHWSPCGWFYPGVRSYRGPKQNRSGRVAQQPCQMVTH